MASLETRMTLMTLMTLMTPAAVSLGAALLLIAGAVGCGGRSVAGGDGGALSDGTAPVDLRGRDRGRRDGALKLDAAPGPYCSGAPHVEIGGTAQTVGEIESGTMLTSCCYGEVVRLKTNGPLGQVNVEVLMLRTPDASVEQLNLNLANPPKGWSFALRCEPYARCGYLHAQNSQLSGSLLLKPIPGPSSWSVALCLRATPRPGITGIKPVRLWATALIKRHCTFGLDQTCNASPLISALYGTCNKDGTCSCDASYVKDPTSGKCKTP